MNAKFYQFLNSIESNNNYLLIESIRNAAVLLFEEPFIDVPPGNTSLVNDFSNSDLHKIEQSDNTNNIHVNNLNRLDVFDIYIEQTGKKRADGKIHEPMSYIRDISDGIAVISPRDNVSIKLSQSDGKKFLYWISENKIAMMSIRKYLQQNPDKASELPKDFYLNALKYNTISKEEVEQFI